MSTEQTGMGGKRWRWIALGTLGIAGAAIGWYAVRNHNEAQAQSQPAGITQNGQAGSAAASDYDRRVVAYIHENEPVTREELGDYLIARRGFEKLDGLVNRRVIEMTAKAAGVDATEAEIETALAESIAGLNVNRKRFVDEILKGYHKTLYEWKEDVLRTKILLTKLVRDRVHVTDEELHKAFDALYGEKVDCRIIIYTESDKELASREYAKLRDDPAAFDLRAKTQATGPLSAAGGKVKPIGRNTLSDRRMEDAVFKLRQGELTELMDDKENKTITLVKCDGRIPADTTKRFETVRGDLARDVFERKLQAETVNFAKELRLKAVAAPVHVLEGEMRQLLLKPGPADQLLVTIVGNVKITRQDLGEYLIERYGAEDLETYVNRRIIDRACKERGINVTPEEIESNFQQEITRLNVKADQFEKVVLAPYGKTLFEFKEDVIRPKLLMTKMCEKRVTWTDEDIKNCFDAKYGEKLKGRMILWPANEESYAIGMYNKLRDDPREFDAMARRQANPRLAAKGGFVDPPIGRHTTGNEDFEKEIFKLQPGEMTGVIKTPQGVVIFKLEERIPPVNTQIDTMRIGLVNEVREQKTILEIPKMFAEMRQTAKPHLLLKKTEEVEDLKASVKRDLTHDVSTPVGKPAH